MRNSCRQFVLFACLASFGPTVCGCTIGHQTEALEAQLRSQEDHLAELASQLERTRADLAAARKDSEALRTQLVSEGKPVIPAEQAEQFYRLGKIRIDTLQSSYLPGDPGQPGHLQISLAPLDEFDTALRIPGEVTLQILSEDSQGNPAGVMAETVFPASEVRKNWNTGWVTSGFVLQWPWPDGLPDPETLDSILLAARFKTLDGRSFESTQKLRLRKSAGYSSSTPIAAHTLSPQTELAPADSKQPEGIETASHEDQPKADQADTQTSRKLNTQELTATEILASPKTETSGGDSKVRRGKKLVPKPKSIPKPAPLLVPPPIDLPDETAEDSEPSAPAKTAALPTAKEVKAAEQPEEKSAAKKLPPPPAPAPRIEHSDSRTIEDFPVYR